MHASVNGLLRFLALVDGFSFSKVRHEDSSFLFVDVKDQPVLPYPNPECPLSSLKFLDVKFPEGKWVVDQFPDNFKWHSIFELVGENH